MADKNGLYLFFDWIELFEELPAKSFKKIVVSLKNFEKVGAEPEGLTKMEAAIFYTISRQLTGMGKRREKETQRKKEWRERQMTESAGQSRDIPGTSPGHPRDVPVTSPGHHTLSKSKSKSKSESKSESKSLSPLTPLSREGGENAEREGKDGFARFWEAYPRKQHKVAAEEEWSRIGPGKELADEIIGGVIRWSTSRQWNQEGTRFVPMPEKFLHNRQWEDEPPGGDAPPATFDTQEFFNAALAKSLGEEGTG